MQKAGFCFWGHLNFAFVQAFVDGIDKSAISGEHFFLDFEVFSLLGQFLE